MKNTLSITAMTLLLFFMVSCGNKQTKTQQEKNEIQKEEHTHQKTEKAVNLTLNNGQKWSVNTEMIPYIKKGNALLNAFIEDKHTDYHLLAQNLKTQNQLLIESCTMTGKSHKELHKWLLPHLELVAKLTKVKDSSEAQKIVRKLQSSYQTYHQYFQ